MKELLKMLGTDQLHRLENKQDFHNQLKEAGKIKEESKPYAKRLRRAEIHELLEYK